MLYQTNKPAAAATPEPIPPIPPNPSPDDDENSDGGCSDESGLGGMDTRKVVDAPLDSPPSSPENVKYCK